MFDFYKVKNEEKEIKKKKRTPTCAEFEHGLTLSGFWQSSQ